MTPQTQVVLHALLADPSAELYGLEIAERTGLLPGSTYPILSRLQQVGWVESRWEQIDEHIQQRPRRRYYRLTANGKDEARQALQEMKPGFVQAVRQMGPEAQQLS
jgi:DNA-binding PadR family transcriptional regulator